jgi:hypothetical protein
MQAITGERRRCSARLGADAAKERFTTWPDIGAAEAHVESLTAAWRPADDRK